MATLEARNKGLHLVRDVAFGYDSGVTGVRPKVLVLNSLRNSMPQLHEYIRDAIDQVDNRGSPSAPFFEKHDSFDVLIDLILNETETTHRELRVSENTYRKKIENIIEDVADSENQIGEFVSQLEEAEKEIRNALNEYRILFPLNFAHNSAPGFDAPITIRDIEFRRTGEPIWDKHQSKASKESNFDEFLEAVPIEEFRTDPLQRQYYWKVSYEAAEPEYAINQIESALKILLGKIAFASEAFVNKQSIRTTYWRYGTIVLNNPLCYLMTKDDEFVTFYTSTDYTPRRRYSLSGNSQDRFEEIYPKLPEFEGELSELEEHLASALKSYYEAITAPDDNDRLHHYWQCLEAATLSQDEDYGAADPLKRARAAARPQLDFEINQDRIERLTNMRNSIIHHGSEQNISEGDIKYLKTLADHAMYFLATDMDNYSFEKFEEFFYYGSKSQEQILQSKDALEKEIQENKKEIETQEEKIESINQIIEWLDFDE